MTKRHTLTHTDVRNPLALLAVVCAMSLMPRAIYGDVSPFATLVLDPALDGQIRSPLFMPNNRAVLMVYNSFNEKGCMIRRIDDGSLVAKMNVVNVCQRAAVSPDGTKVLAGDSGIQRGFAYLFDAATGEELWVVAPPGWERVYGNMPVTYYEVFDLAFSPEGDVLAVAISGTVAIRDTETGEERTVFYTGGSYDVRFLSGGARLFAQTPWSASVYDVFSGERLMRFEDYRGQLLPDGRSIVLSKRDEASGECRVIDGLTGEEVRPCEPAYGTAVTGSVVATDERVLARDSTGGVSLVRVAENGTQTELARFEIPATDTSPVSGRDYASDHSKVLVSTHNAVYIYDISGIPTAVSESRLHGRW